MDGLNISAPDNLREQSRFLEYIIQTRKGTLPGNRDYGLDASFLDAPAAEAGTRFAMAAHLGARDWLDGAQVTKADYRAGEDGRITAYIELGGKNEFV